MQHDLVKDYYGQVLKTNADLKTSACCTADAMPPYLRSLASNLHQEVSEKYYGCGLVAPAVLEGRKVLDLGCGSGHDVYILSQLAGENGHVAGVDMTDEQLAVAAKHIDWHTEKFGFKSPNVSFHHGYIERLDDLGLTPGTLDVIVSNCVINLSPDKRAVLKGAYDLLAKGGEMYFSDVYVDRRLPSELMTDQVLLGECLSGALYWNDFLTLAKETGFADPRLVTSRILEVTNPAVKEKLGNARFYSATYRLFKLDNLEGSCEDYGQAVIYKGGIPEQPDVFLLDNHHMIERGKVFPVCGNTWHMLQDTRFAPHFEFIGNFDTHYGIFDDCGAAIPFAERDPSVTSGACC